MAVDTSRASTENMTAGLGAPQVTAPKVTAPQVTAPKVTAPKVTAPKVTAPKVTAPEVLVQLALLVSAAEPGALNGFDSEGALGVVEAAEAVKAWADSVSLAATSAMVDRFETDFRYLAPENPSTSAWTRFLRTCRSAAAREIQVATGLPVTQCQRRVWLAACEPERVAPVREAMKAGRLTFARAAVLAEATAHLDAVTAAAIATRVLRPLTGPDGVPLSGMAPLSQATFAARLRTQLVLAHGLVGEATRTYAEALKARRLSAELHPDGTGVMFLSGDGARITAAAGRVDRIARRLRKAGDSRTLVQLRADVATDLLLRGWIPSDPTFAQLGEAPAATVNVVVSLATLLGADRGVGHIPGWGAVSAQQARRLALAAGSVWKRVVTDPLTGRAIEATAGTYRVPAAMAEQVKIRDGICRAPGCEIPAQGTDLDHSIEWTTSAMDTDADTKCADGTTTETNLVALHRGHHNLKTSGFWDSIQSPDGSLCWTTAAGRKVTTYPYVYDHPDSQPVDTSSLEVRLGRRVARVINPAIPLPARLSIFDEISWAAALAPATPEPPRHQWPTPGQNESRTGRATALSGPPPF